MINLTLFEFNYGWLHKTWVCTVEFPCEGLNDPVFVILGARVKVKTITAELTGQEQSDRGAVQLQANIQDWRVFQYHAFSACIIQF